MASPWQDFDFDCTEPRPPTPSPVERDVSLSALLRQPPLLGEQQASRSRPRNELSTWKAARKRRHESPELEASQPTKTGHAATLQAFEFDRAIKHQGVLHVPTSDTVASRDAALMDPWRDFSALVCEDAQTSKAASPHQTIRETLLSMPEPRPAPKQPRGPPFFTSYEWDSFYGFPEHCAYHSITALDSFCLLSFEELRLAAYQGWD